MTSIVRRIRAQLSSTLSKSARESACALAAIASLAVLTVPAHAQSVEEFYRGKTIIITIGFAPGGSYDYYPRLFARYMGKYIPGNPNIIVQNMPGAASMRAANHLYNVAPRDGTVLGVLTQTFMLEAPFGTPGVNYNAVDFTYVGRMSSVLDTMSLWHESKAQTLDDLRRYETVAGGSGPASPTEAYPKLLNAFAGTKFRVVLGFHSTNEIMLAMERREVDATAVSWNSMRRSKRDWLDQGKLKVLVQAELERSKELPDTPTLVEMGATAEDRAAIALYVSTAAVSRSIIGPPGIPADRLKALRDAFQRTASDPELLTEIKKTGSEFEPATGEYLQDLAQKVHLTPPEVVRRTAAALRAK